MTLDDVRNGIINTLNSDAILKGLSVDVRSHRGELLYEELAKIAVRPMTCLVSFLGVKEADLQAGEVRCRCLFGAFVVATDKPKVPRDSAALVIVTRLLMAVPGNLWGLNISAPEKVAANNLYPAGEEQALALWAVTWEQPVAFDVTDLTDDTVLDDFLRFHADWDLGPTPDGRYEASDDVALRENSE